jgi:membrane protein YqaA with SNARE-associated domain
MRFPVNLMKPLRLAKAIALSFALGAILSVTSDTTLVHQVEAMALAQAKVIATSAMQKVGSTLGDWLEQWLDTALKGI